MPTLPREDRGVEWGEARQMHFDRFSERIGDILDFCVTCTDKKEFLQRVGWFIKKSGVKNADELTDHVFSPFGTHYLRILGRNHNKASLDKNLLTGNAEYLLEVLEDVCEEVGGLCRYYSSPTVCVCNKLLQAIFDYDSFADNKLIKKNSSGRYSWGSDAKRAKWGAASYIRKTGLKYCPYCNAETIYVVPKVKDRNSDYKSALDHFLPRSEYPFFGLSLYNLIPSCTRCNSAYKSSRDPLRYGTNVATFHAIKNTRLAHPFIEDIYSDFRLEPRFSDVSHAPQVHSRTASFAIKYLKNDSSKSALKTEGLMQGFSRAEETYNACFADEATVFIHKLSLLRPKGLSACLNEILSKEANQFREKTYLLCGFNPEVDNFLDYRLGKMYSDFYEMFRDLI